MQIYLHTALRESNEEMNLRGEDVTDARQIRLL